MKQEKKGRKNKIGETNKRKPKQTEIVWFFVSDLLALYISFALGLPDGDGFASLVDCKRHI